MKGLFAVAVVFTSFGLLLGFYLRGGSPIALAGGGRVEKCAAKNGDVNADGAVNLSDAVTILGHLFLGNPTELLPLCAPAGSSGLPHTGQTKCYGFVQGRGWTEVPCGAAVCQGQDGAHGAGCPSEDRFVDNGDGTVTDTCTGLQWQKDTADTNGDGRVVDDGSDALSVCDALAYCESLSFAGHDDWRLPNVRELQSIVDYGRESPSINTIFSSLSSVYWSSTSRVQVPALSWQVGFDVGALLNSGKGEALYIRAVRTGP